MSWREEDDGEEEKRRTYTRSAIFPMSIVHPFVGTHLARQPVCSGVFGASALIGFAWSARVWRGDC